MIQLNKISLQRGNKFLLEQTSASFHPGQKWGVIGNNGCGKSSLFKLLLGDLQEETGEVQLPAHWRIAHMAQEVGASDATALDYILDGDSELRRLEDAIDQAKTSDDGEKLARLYADFERIDGYSAPTRAHRLLDGLGFANDAGTRPVNSFSGGWRIRLNLARALMCPSDLLLLDEPTNHLDLDATLWLETWLKAYKGTLIIISHDRDFLDSVTSHILSFENQQLVSYTGNYSEFEKQRAERLSLQAQAFEKQQQRIAEIEKFVSRFRAKATKARQAQSRLKELDRMEKIAPAHIDSPFSFSFPEPDKLPQTLISLSRAAIGYGETPIAQKIDLSLLDSTRVGLLGPNGAGKTTLIKTLANELPLIGGEKSEAQYLKLGYFAQHQLESLDLSASPLLHLRRLTPDATEQAMRNFLGGFGFHGDEALSAVEGFSGGEKARLALAIIAWQKPNLLLLDEPTNHLDLEMRHALTMALQNFSGAIVVVSHDRHLLRSTVDQFILVDGGKVEMFDGDLDDYRQHIENRKTTTRGSEDNAEKPAQDKKKARQDAAEKRRKLQPFTKEVQKLEKQMEQLQARLREVEEQLADPTLYGEANDRMQNLLKEQGQIRNDLSDTEETWLAKSEELEQLSAEIE